SFGNRGARAPHRQSTAARAHGAPARGRRGGPDGGDPGCRALPDRRRRGGMNVLVTGGAGFIGSHVADAFLARGDRVWVLDNLTRGKRANVPAKAELVVADVADPSV